MSVQLLSITPNIEPHIVHIARVSSARKDTTSDSERLINYLIKHKHWSPFELNNMTVEIITSRTIEAQIVRHRSFSFQIFSGRYQDYKKLGENIFEDIELRKQAENNRQSSTDVFDPDVWCTWRNEHGVASEVIDRHLHNSESLYNELLKAGVARECARMVLPMATKVKIYMSGNIRSWIHFLELRDDEHAQKEIQLIAKDIKQIFKQQLPIISKALNYA